MAKKSALDECLALALKGVQKAFGDDAEAAKDLVSRLEEAAKTGVDADQLESIMNDVTLAMLEKARIESMDNVKMEKFGRLLSSIPEADQAEALFRMVSVTTGSFRKIDSLGPSIESRIKTTMGGYGSTILNEVDKFQQQSKFVRIKELAGMDIQDKEMGLALVRLILDPEHKLVRGNLTPEQLGTVRAFASGFQLIQKQMQASARKAGILAKFQDGYWFRNYSTQKMRFMGRDEYVKRTAPRLSKSKHGDVETTAGMMWDKYVGTEGQNARTKSSMNYERTIEFESPQHEFDHWVEFADASPINTLVGRVEAITRHIEAAEVLGPSSVRNFEQIAGDISKRIDDGSSMAPADRGIAKRSLDRANKTFNDMMGVKNSVTEITPGAHIIEGLKGWFVSTVFATVGKWHLVDSMQLFGRVWSGYAGSHGMLSEVRSAIPTFTNQLRTTVQMAWDKGDRDFLIELAVRTGMANNINIGATSNRFGIDDVYPFLTGNGDSEKLRRSALERGAEAFHTRASRSAAGSINLLGSARMMQIMQSIAFDGISQNLSMLRSRSMSDILANFPEMWNRLDIAGITPEVWDRVRINDEAFPKRGWGKHQAELLDVYKLEDADRFLMSGYMQREGIFAIHNPTAYSKAMTRIPVDKGRYTVKEAGVQSLTQFWSITLQSWRTVTPGAVPIHVDLPFGHSIGRGNRQEHLSLAGRGKKAGMIIAPLITGGSMLAVANEIMKGREPDDFDSATFGLKALQNSGVLPVLDQIALGLHQGAKWGKAPDDIFTDTLISSPVAGTVFDIGADFAKGVANGDTDKMLKAAYRTIPAQTALSSLYGVGQWLQGDAEPQK